MALPDILTGLLLPAAYSHACAGIRLVETHVSWVLLTGDYAYKIKKPVRLPFVDFATLERRRFFCEEELRCNRRFAPELYLGVVPVRVDATGALELSHDGAGEIIEWAVRMRQFPPDRELDRLLEAGRLAPGCLRQFGARLADTHATLPRLAAGADEIGARVLGPVAENFSTLTALGPGREELAALERVRSATERLAAALHARFAARFEGGYVRECHGDLHLGNLVLLDGRVTAFDCLEFDANLRWIDTLSDVAFLFMDCLVRNRADLAYAFLDGYLDTSGDYPGVVLLPYYAVYRAMVRAKVAGIQALQQARQADGPAAPPDDSVVAASSARLRAHLFWADAWLRRGPARVILMSGVSGSGKSYLAERLAVALPAIRLRSDVARRALDEDPRAGPAGRYAPERRAAVYERLGDLLDALVPQGETVILDGTFISAPIRRSMLERARSNRWPVVILHCHAPRAILEARIRQRTADGRDPSEADLAVLDDQLGSRDPFGADEPVLHLDTTIELDEPRIAEIRAAVLAGLG